MLWGQMSIWGHLGSLRSKGHFQKKCYNSSMLHSMTIRLIHVHLLETLYLCYGVKCHSGVIWGHWGQKFIFTKKCYNSSMLHSMAIRLITCWSAWDALPMLWGQMSIWGHLGSLRSKGHFHQKCYNSSMLHSMTIRLIHVHQLETLYLYVMGSNVILGSLGSKDHFH